MNMAYKYPSPPASPHNLDDLLKCPVCLDTFKDPKTLSCLHSFCTACLENCRRAYRRDITCPVCKKVTVLSPLGVQGLQNDFRIQQIRDLLINRAQSPVSVGSDDENSMSDPGKLCDLCKSEHKSESATTHCIQCYMYFCTPCTTKHNQNALFSSHHVFNMGENSKASEVLFCKNHKEHPVRYFCKPCSVMLCTICTMNHDMSHAPEPLDKGIIEKYRKELTQSLRSVKSKLTEVKSHAKYLETIKETHQQAQYAAQRSIREKTEELIAHIREQEQHLLQEVQQKIEARMMESGLENLGEIRFHKSNMEQLYLEISKVVKGSPQECLVAYEDLINKLKSATEQSIPTVGKGKLGSVVKFVPATDDLNILIGTLQECQVSDDCIDIEMVDSPLSTSPNVCSNSFAIGSPSTKSQPRRVTSILNALSPSRKGDVKIGKVKAYSACAERPKSPSRKINADDLLNATPVSPGVQDTTQSTSGQPSSPSLGREDAFPSNIRPKLLFKVDDIGGWPGKITTPTSLAFSASGHVVVAEGESRLQIFDATGKSLKIIGWGKVKPQSVIAFQDGRLAITDRNDHCIKIFSQDGDPIGAWGAGMFSAPAGLASMSNGNFVVTDTDRHAVSIHRSDGSLIHTFGTWGSGDYQFNNPGYIATDREDNIYVSDTSNGCIKIYDKCGVFKKKFSLCSTKTSNHIRRPVGITADKNGQVLVADRDNHRVTMFNSDGQFVRHLLTKQDGVRFPCDVKITGDNLIGVVESHSGFLGKDPHHAVKMFALGEST